MRIGVFICHCGKNIAGVIDIKSLTKAVAELEDVYYATDYVYLCSEPGQKAIQDQIKELGLTHIVVAACSPKMHATTFAKALEDAGVNAYLLEIANIREQCSWVHSHEPEKATAKALELIKAMVRAEIYAEKHPMTTESVDKTFALFEKFRDVFGGITFLLYDSPDQGYDIHVEGITAKWLPLKKLLRGAVGEHFVGKFATLFRQNKIASLTLGSTITQEEFQKFLNCMYSKKLQINS